MSKIIEGQLHPAERELLMDAILRAPKKPKAVIEVGAWLGGGSTLHILRALEKNSEGHLWGIEADEMIYKRMIENIQAGVPEAAHRFTPLFGFSQKVIPKWLAGQPAGFAVDFAFLDGGDNPKEQLTEFALLDPWIPVGGQLMSHDAKMRKGKWFVPYLSQLDNWETKLYELSEVGLFYARKISEQPSAQSRKAARRCLRKLQMDLPEIVGAMLPKQVCKLIWTLLPQSLARSLSQGKK